MSLETQRTFKFHVEQIYSVYSARIALGAPLFTYHGFMTIAQMTAPGGRIELICAPPEYHVEIFVYDGVNRRSWNLGELMEDYRSVRDWLMSRASINKGDSRLESEVWWAFDLMCEGLEGVPELDWIRK